MCSSAGDHHRAALIGGCQRPGYSISEILPHIAPHGVATPGIVYGHYRYLIAMLYPNAACYRV
jgi:hypothetical protein